MFTDPIADYLTRIRNAQSARHKVVEIPASNLKKEITAKDKKVFTLLSGLKNIVCAPYNP